MQFRRNPLHDPRVITAIITLLTQLVAFAGYYAPHVAAPDHVEPLSVVTSAAE